VNTLYMYAITDQPDMPLPVQAGLEEAALLAIRCQEIGAVVSPLAARAVTPSEENLWRHEAVVEALMVDRAVLPARFGSLVASAPAVRLALAARYAELVANLGQVRGRVELGARVLWDSDQPGHKTSEVCPKSNGWAYLMGRLEEERRRQAQRQQAEELARTLDAPLARLSAARVQRTLVTPRLLFDAAYLVDRDRVAAFRQAVEALTAAHPQLHFLCTGPWPPYSFTNNHQDTKSQRI
jgi:hypothetical protein